jgi:hypothetical protein
VLAHEAMAKQLSAPFDLNAESARQSQILWISAFGKCELVTSIVWDQTTFPPMKSIVELEIEAPLEKVAVLLADPVNMTKWMDDLERVEPLSGEPGMPGSTFRMVGKAGGPQSDFVVTVTARTLPGRLELKLQSPSVEVAVADTLIALSARRTKLVSEEVFSFHGLFNALFGFLAQSTIRKHHRRHIQSFKRFAEGAL